MSICRITTKLLLLQYGDEDVDIVYTFLLKLAVNDLLPVIVKVYTESVDITCSPSVQLLNFQPIFGVATN